MHLPNTTFADTIIDERVIKKWKLG